MSVDLNPINSFQRDDMSIRARKARNKSSKRRALANRPDVLGPTPERLAKVDAPVLLGSGTYRAPMPIERMRDRGQLDPTPHLNEAMFLAAEKLVTLFEGAGLASTVRAQDLTRVIGGAGEGGDHHAAHCLLEFRRACILMGWSVAHPHRGAGRITVAVVCEGQGLKEAAAVYRSRGRAEVQLAAGKEALCEGLFALALHWRLA